MRSFMTFACLAALVACTACASDGTLDPRTVNALRSACVIDGIEHPMINMAASAAGYGAIDNAAYMAAQANCAALCGTAVPPAK